MLDETQRQVEAAMIGRQAGQAAARDGDPVISARAGDELFLLRPPDRVVVEPHELDDAVVGLGPRIGEEDAVEPLWRHLHKPLGQFDRRLGGFAREGMIVGQLGQLSSCRVDQALLAEAYAHAPKAGHRLDVLLSLVVIDVNALAAIDHDRSGLFVAPRVRVRMKQVSDVPRVDRIRRVIEFGMTFIAASGFGSEKGRATGFD